MEALDNAWEHGNKKDASRKIIVGWTITLDFLIIFIKNEGDGFHHTLPDSMPPSANLRERGLFSINELVDTISFNTSGNQITLHFARGDLPHEFLPQGSNSIFFRRTVQLTDHAKVYALLSTR